MSFATDLELTLNETLDELCLAEDLGLTLNEIRDPERLRSEMDRLSKSKHKTAASRLARLQALHDRKVSSTARREERHKAISSRQHDIATSHGYRRHSSGHYIHDDTGHVLMLHDGGGWTHIKGGKKKGKAGDTPIRSLKHHLRKLHTEEVNLTDLQEIRSAERLRMQINHLAAMGHDPYIRQKIMRLQALQQRKMDTQLNSESEEPQTKPKVDWEKVNKSAADFLAGKKKGIPGMKVAKAKDLGLKTKDLKTK